MQCDICDQPGAGSRVGPQDMRDAVERGFDPFGANLVRPAARAQWASEALYGSANPLANWRRHLVATDQSDWNLCAPCRSAVEPYLGGVVRPRGNPTFEEYLARESRSAVAGEARSEPSSHLSAPANDRGARLQRVEVEADRMEEAEKRIGDLVPQGHAVVARQVLSDGRERTVHAAADTVEAAFAKAEADVPDGVEPVERLVLGFPGLKVFTVDAFDEHGAREAVPSAVAAAATVAVKVVAPGKKGFLGIGRRPHRYEVQIESPAEVQVTFRPKVRLAAKLADRSYGDEIERVTIRSVELVDQEQARLEACGGRIECLAPSLQNALQLEDWDGVFSISRVLAHLFPEQANSWCMCAVALHRMDESAWATALLKGAAARASGEAAEQGERPQPIGGQLPHDNLRLAVAYANRALELDPDLHMAWYIKGHSMAQLGAIAGDAWTLQRGLECFDDALRTKPGDPASRDAKARFMEVHGRLTG